MNFIGDIGKYKTFEDVRQNDAVVHRMMEANTGAEAIIIELANEKAALIDRLMKLDAIAPRKIKTDDGRIFVWRCPDHLIPD